MVDVAELGRGVLEHADEGLADAFALRFGVRDAGKLTEEALLRVDEVQLHAHVLRERLLHLLRLAGAHDAVVDEHADQPVADRCVRDRCRHRGVDAAGEGADRPAVADLRLHACDRGLEDLLGRPAAATATDVEQEVAQDLGALGRVHDLGVELDAEAVVAVRDHGMRRVRRVAHGLEAGRRLRDAVAVAHPDGERRGQVIEKRHGSSSSRIAGPYSRCVDGSTLPPRW